MVLTRLLDPKDFGLVGMVTASRSKGGARNLRWRLVPELIEEIHRGIYPSDEPGPARGEDRSLSTPNSDD